MRRPDDQPVGIGQDLQHRGILDAERLGHQPARALRRSRRAHSLAWHRWPPSRCRVRPRGYRARTAVPASRAISGFRNRFEQTRLATGLPGRPITRVAPSRPNISGLPGRIAIFQKSSCMPLAVSTALTRSWSPTEAPPSVTMMSALASSASADAGRHFVLAVADDAEVDRVGSGSIVRSRRRHRRWRK